VKKIPRCQEHIGMGIDTYCKTCKESICAKCILANHKGHDVCLLDEVTGLLQDQIAGYTITISQREEAARKAIITLDGTINKIEEHRSTAEKEIAKVFDAVAASLEERRVQVLQQMQDKGDQLRKMAVKEKGEAESATVEFREFRTFTEGLLAQGSPHEIAGTYKMVRLSVFPLYLVMLLFTPFSLFCRCVVIQVQARNETLEKLQFPKQPSVSPVFKFSSDNVDDVKRVISTLGSIVIQTPSQSPAQKSHTTTSFFSSPLFGGEVGGMLGNSRPKKASGPPKFSSRSRFDDGDDY